MQRLQLEMLALTLRLELFGLVEYLSAESLFPGCLSVDHFVRNPFADY